MRGTIVTQNWAVNLHWRFEPVGSPSEVDICKAIAEHVGEFYIAHYKNMSTFHTTLTKVKVVGYGDPESFYELPASVIGDYSGEIAPSFVAKGWRQFRSNSNFRTSTHRFPEVMEANNSDGSWVYTTDVTSAKTAAVSAFMTGNRDILDVSDAVLGQLIPVLIRTQNTVTDIITGEKTTTYFTPPQVSDVADAGFYGITSQVSRKYILPT